MASRVRRSTAVPNSIRRLRLERGLSTRALARQAGINQSQVVRWESGQQGFLLDNALLLARVLEVSVEELMAEPEPLPNNIRALRQERGLTETDLAARAGVGQRQLSLWETGQRRLTLESAVALARVLDVPIEALMTAPPAAAQAS